jgi:hypothetical protein
MNRASAHRRALRRIALVALALLLLPPAVRAADTAPRPRARAHNAEFVMPDGWLRGNSEAGNLILVPPDLPAGERVEIHVAPFDQAPRGLRGHVDQSVANFEAGFTKARVEQPAAAGRLPCGADTMAVLVSGDYREAPGRGVIVNFTEIDGGGGSSQGVAFVASTRELFQEYRPRYDELLGTVTLPSLTRVAEGRDGAPPLTLYAVNAVIDFIEWVLDVPFTQAQRDDLKEHFVAAWNRGNRGEIDGVGQILQGRLALDKLTDPDKKELARQSIRAEVLKQWRASAGRGDALTRQMIDIYDAAHQPLVAGDPPLTRQATDATIEVIHFMASRVAGAGDFVPSAPEKEQFAKSLAAAYPTMPKENRDELAKMPTYWAALRVAWPELSRDEQSKLTAAWADSDQVKPVVEQIRAAQAKAAAQRAAAGGTSPNSDSMAALKAMQELNRQHENFVMLSNISHQMHMSRMQIINNIGSSNYRYEYRPTYQYR